MTDNELIKFREELLNKVNLSHLDWVPVPLTDGSTYIEVKVSKPMVVDGYFLPVTPKETFAFARRFAAYPLTRAVADQYYKRASDQLDFVGQYPKLRNFDEYTAKLKAVNYGVGTVKAGLNKLWLLSSKGKSINYGGWTKKPAQKSYAGGKHLKGSGATVYQDIGGAHNDAWWDYSQLLQLMQADAAMMIDGKHYSLGMAIVEGFAHVWDEDKKITFGDLP